MTIPSYKLALEGEAADDLYEHLVRLEIEEEIGKASRVLFRLSITLQEDGEWTYLKDERFSLFNKIEVSIGAGEEDAVPVFTGYITQLAPHFDPQEELCYYEVRGMDPSCLLNLEEKLTTWADQSHGDIVKEIFGLYGITPDVGDAPAMHKTDGNVLVQRCTDMRFLMQLAEKNGFDCYVAVDEAGEVKGHFKPYALDASPLPPLAVHFEEETNVEFIDIQASGDLPLGWTGWHMSLEDKSVEQVEKAEYGEQLLGKESLIDIVKSKVAALCAPAEAPSRAYKGDLVFLDAQELGGALSGRQDRSGWFIRAKAAVNGEAYGNVIRTRRLLPIKGMGTRYSGNYFVCFVKHVIAEGDFVQHVELMKNGWGISGDEAFAGGT
jgi:hypothetical protein